MNATITQLTRLKALSKRVLQRNHERNHNATTPENLCNFYHEKHPQKLRSVASDSSWKPEQKAWISDTGELRTQGVFEDLAGEIVKLTADNLVLQKILLLSHCEAYDRHHFPELVERWDKRAAILQLEGGTSRQEAVQAAAQVYHLKAFVTDLIKEPK